MNETHSKPISQKMNQAGHTRTVNPFGGVKRSSTPPLLNQVLRGRVPQENEMNSDDLVKLGTAQKEIPTSVLVKTIKAQCLDISETAKDLRSRGIEVVFLAGHLVDTELTVKVSEVL